MGMFLPAFFTGHLIQRFGVFNMMLAGIALLICGVAVALLGTTYRPAERGKAQAFNDFMVFGTTATASLMASVVLELKGWAFLNYLAFALVFIALMVIGTFRLRHPARA